jgi:hypothetical protein
MKLASAWEEMGGRATTPRTPTRNLNLREGESQPRGGGGPDLLLEWPPFLFLLSLGPVFSCLVPRVNMIDGLWR